jgi:hypothetical protein
MAYLIRDLILHLHDTEPDPDAVILVFLPTYRALLLQHNLLQDSACTPARGAGHTSAQQGYSAQQEQQEAPAQLAGADALDVFALHSSVDIDEALEAIQGPRVAGRRRVVLATNCAESSITLPNVKHVVDSCTTNQVSARCHGCLGLDCHLLRHGVGIPFACPADVLRVEHQLYCQERTCHALPACYLLSCAERL